MLKRIKGYLNTYSLSFLSYTVGITILSLSRLDNRTPGLFRFEYADKLVHTVFYLFFTLLLGVAISKAKKRSLNRLELIWVGIVGLLYSGGVELAQKFLTNYRSAELADLGANALGILTGVIVLSRLKLA